jgi:hypothetical protein
VSSPLINGAGNAVHLVPLKWIVEFPAAQMSFAEDAEAAKRLLLNLFSFGVGTTLKIEPAPVCPCAGVP